MTVPFLILPVIELSVDIEMVIKNDVPEPCNITMNCPK